MKGMLVAILATVTASAAGCGDAVSPAPETVLTEVRTSAHGVYRFAPGDTVDVEDQEEYYVWLLDTWDLQITQPLQYFKYRNRSHLKELTGQETNGWAERGTYRFHTIWPIDNHESVHALVNAELGAPPALMNEGLAVAHQAFPPRGWSDPRWSGTNIDTLAARFLRNGDVPPLAALLRSRDFFEHDTQITYPVAGSFVKSVLERHGYERMKAFIRESDFEDTAARFRANFRAVFGEELDAAWERWAAARAPSG